jgi:hypothetical protein
MINWPVAAMSLAIFIGGEAMDKYQIKIRLPKHIYEDIKRSAEVNLRSISAEVSYRLLQAHKENKEKNKA